MGDLINPKRRVGIRPLCPIHLEEMSGPTDETTQFFSCRRRGCDLHWSPSSDYFRFFEGKPFRTFPQLQEEVFCSKVSHGHKFIAKVKWSKAVWECSVEGCAETEGRPLPPSSLWEAPKERSRSASR